ncbi:aspartate/glutamate racemase family protein [Glaciecola petra]|uniref:Amino acid racemase n=1 Tax=Glaciecola petra TaxID=3075602 RepID=A0ABU2ZPI5_9ALTE|nr:amino acid racemase [Aestuariibacter sp. P117]MDT0593509.1 amino acid racemase [Aestuariibacter sp. P117]
MQRPYPQKTIGILGGMSNRATVEYYDAINNLVNQELGAWDIAETLIIGCNFGNIEYFVRQNRWQEAEQYLIAKAIAAEKGGADILICMSNTMHKVLNRIEQHLSIPFLHIATPTAREIKKFGLQKVALLGTKPIMSEAYMREKYEAFGIEVIVPSEQEQHDVDTIIFDELVKNVITTGSKQRYIQICENLRTRGSQGIILGCTEIFLLIQQSDFNDLPLFNTTELHVKAVVESALSSAKTIS